MIKRYDNHAVTRSLLALISAMCLTMANAAFGAEKLNANDVSWLFPMPQAAADLGKVMAIETLKADDGKLLWPQEAFDEFLAIADSAEAEVPGGPRIKLPPEVRKISAWKIAGVRFDGSAPGAAPGIIEKFGSDPQIRIILQPVTEAGGKLNVHDIAAHLVFNFSTSKDVGPGNLATAIPDKPAFQEIVDGLAKVKATAKGLGAVTADQKLGVHPGLASAASAAAVLAEMNALLVKNVPKGRLRAMAIMGLANEQEPWIFLAIIPDAKRPGKFMPAPGFNMPSPTNTAQALSMIASKVLPTPVTNNLNPITNQFIVPIAARRGVSTATLFTGADLDAPAIPGDPAVTNRDIPDIVADPGRAHFFNTDCVSCHTETTRAKVLKIKPGKFAFKPPADFRGVEDAVTPKDDWNLRNFGWGPPSERHATVTQRAANETAEAVEFINQNYLGGTAP